MLSYDDNDANQFELIYHINACVSIATSGQIHGQTYLIGEIVWILIPIDFHKIVRLTKSHDYLQQWSGAY